MYTDGRMQRWSVIPLFIAALLALGTTTAALAGTSTAPALGPSCDTQAKGPPQRDPPPGQLTRRGVIGDVVRLVNDEGTLVAIVVGTQFGTVKIGIPEGLETSAGVGDRVAVLTAKEPKPPVDSPPPEEGGTDTPITIVVEEGETDTPPAPFRTTVAKKITVIPGKTSLSHNRAVVQSQGDGTTEIIDDEGNVDEFDTTGDGGVQVPPDEGDGGTTSNGGTTGDGDDPPPEVEDETISSGTDAILLVQCSGSGSDPVIRGMVQAARIADRLVRIQAKFEDNPEKLAKFQELNDKQLERVQDRLDRTATTPRQVLKAVWARPSAKLSVNAKKTRTLSCAPTTHARAVAEIHLAVTTMARVAGARVVAVEMKAEAGIRAVVEARAAVTRTRGRRTTKAKSRTVR